VSGDFPAPDPETGLVRADESTFLFPALHQSLEFAVLVRRAFFAVRPDAVVLELPRTIESAFRQALLRLPRLTVVLYPEAGETIYLLVEPHEAMVEAGRLALENGCELVFADRDDGSYPFKHDATPDTWALTRLSAGDFNQALLESLPPSPDPRDQLRERAMAFAIDRLREQGKKVLWVGGAAHVRGILKALEEPLAEPFSRVKREGVQLAAIHEDSAREVMSEIAFVSASFEEARSAGRAMAFDAKTDSQRVLDELLRKAAERYETEQRTDITRRQLAVLRQFSRNLALAEGVLTPAFYELIVAARGAVDDDFAWYVWDIGSAWPWPDRSRSLPVITLSRDDFQLDGKTIHFRRRFPGKEERLRRLPLRKRPKEKRKGEWDRFKFGDSICSHPPEDIQVEAFGNKLRFQALHRLSEESRRVFPMTVSLLDGIDIRESFRKLHENRLYVFEERRIHGGLSSVVVIFDEEEVRYPWHVTWMGEHGQESDMAFYATPKDAEKVGPGISRCQYGGFLMTMPPGRLYDVWSDPDYQGLESAPDILLAAALDYAPEPRVVYVAKRPPGRHMRRVASRLGKQIVYLPIGVLPRDRVQKLRRFHVLANKLVRTYANDFIGE
jgi:hypothetical protein